jgi:hypothetical protein
MRSASTPQQHFGARTFLSALSACFGTDGLAWVLSLGGLLLNTPVLLADSLPPLITTAGTSTLDSGGRPWAFLAFGENAPGLIAGRRLAVYAKPGNPDSPGTFTFRGAAASTTDPTALQVLLNRAASVGDNLAALEAQLIALQQSLMAATPPAMPLAQRLSSLLNRASGDSALGQMLDIYGLTHPALRLARGTAWAGALDFPAGSPVTVEIRERDLTGNDLAVIGRVTVQAGQGELLPAPGPVVVVPDLTSTGDLNVKLRWATPDLLRHAGTRHHGDLVWRVARAFAESQGFAANPPSGKTLDALTLSNPLNVKRVGGPVFPAKLFFATDVADFAADAATVYVSDNNDRYAASGTPIPEGSQCYYFAAAADALGRPGMVSTGVLATFCGRVPPSVPTRLGVVNQWSQANGQFLDISWFPNGLADATSTTRYDLFRGDDLTQLAAAQRGELDLDANPIVSGRPTAIQRIGSLPDPGPTASQSLHFSDSGDGAPGKTWWYAIRALHQGPAECGDLSSALSPPVFGALRDHSAPPAPDTNLITAPVGECLRVGCISDVPAQPEVASTPLDQTALQFIARCDRRPGIVAAHFQVIDTVDNTQVVPETAVVYAEGDSTVEFTWTWPLALQSHALMVQCRAEALGQSLSAWAPSQAPGVSPAGNQRVAFHFLAGAIAKSELATLAAGDPLWTALLFQPPQPCPGDLHLVVSPLSGKIFHPTFCLPLTQGTEQYRVYRRVADGPLTLIAQGLQSYSGPGCNLTIEDTAPPVSNGQVLYFAQLLDEQGHASAMRKMGSLRFTGVKPPVPVLFTPQAADYGGTVNAPTVALSWFCPPEHVERFEVFFQTAQPSNAASQGISSVPGNLSVLTLKAAAVPTVHKITSRTDSLLVKLARIEQSFLTGRVGGDFGAGPRFTLPMQVDPNLRYTVWLRALGPNGEPSENSRSIDFQWQPPAPPPATIAWPARPLPPVAQFNSGINVIDFSTVPSSRLIWGSANNAAVQIPLPSVSVDATPIGIRVGSLAIDNDQAKRGFDSSAPFGPIFYTPTTSKTLGKADPNAQVFTGQTDPAQHLFPGVLYRQQIANSTFPNVSGDVIQCSPLIRSIAWIAGQVNAQVQLAELADPYFRWVGPDLPTTPTLDLYLVDTQPVVAGAQYRYWLTRFSDWGEPIQTVPCGQVTVQAP